MLRLILTIFVAICAALPAEGLAQSILISDCQGFTRAAKSVDPGSLNKVEINVADASGSPANGVEVSMTNTATGEVSTAIANNGVAVFENVASGAFTVSTTATGTTVGAVGIGAMGVGVAAATGAVAGAGLVVGGTTAAVASEVQDQIDSGGSGSGDDDDDSGDDDDGASPTPEPTAIPLPEPTPTEDDITDDCPACDPDEEAPPLDDEDDFFDPDKPPLSPAS